MSKPDLYTRASLKQTPALDAFRTHHASLKADLAKPDMVRDLVDDLKKKESAAKEGYLAEPSVKTFTAWTDAKRELTGNEDCFNPTYAQVRHLIKERYTRTEKARKILHAALQDYLNELVARIDEMTLQHRLHLEEHGFPYSDPDHVVPIRETIRNVRDGVNRSADSEDWSERAASIWSRFGSLIRLGEPHLFT